MELMLTSEERKLLIEVLSDRQRELIREIARTHHHQFKTALKESERLLAALLDKLNVAEPVHA